VAAATIDTTKKQNAKYSMSGKPIASKHGRQYGHLQIGGKTDMSLLVYASESD